MAENVESVLRKTPLFASLTEKEMSALAIERIGPLVLPINFPEESFKLADFCFRNVRPNLKDGKMAPQLSLPFAIGVSV
jgi:hypothetical protein